jgi:hypothetical protein
MPLGLGFGLDYGDHRRLGRGLLGLAARQVVVLMVVGMVVAVLVFMVMVVTRPLLVNVGQGLGQGFLSTAITHRWTSVLNPMLIL